jgi:hypothetical protein
VEVDAPRLTAGLDGGWPQRLLVTCAVVDMTLGAAGGVRAHVGLQGRDGAPAWLPWRGGRALGALEREVLGAFVVHATAGVDTAWARWQARLQQARCAARSVRAFFEEEAACAVLGFAKARPMQVRLDVVSLCLLEPKCVDWLLQSTVLVFLREAAVDGAVVAGTVVESAEVALGATSADAAEQSQRRALLRMQNFTAANQHVAVDAWYFERNMRFDAAEQTHAPWQAHAVDAYSRCAVLVSTAASILCAGSEDAAPFMGQYWDC